jgi:Uma2 family endonuclease
MAGTEGRFVAMSTATKLTYEDYLAIPDDGRRHEIIDGEHYVVPAPNTSHQLVSGNIYFALALWVREHASGVVMYSPVDVILSEHDIVEPDLVFVRSENASRVEQRGIAGSPDLVVEILSPSNRRYDQVRKRELYERFGVPEYWIVDCDERTVKVLRLRGARYAEIEIGDILTSPLLPGFTLPLATLFP